MTGGIRAGLPWLAASAGNGRRTSPRRLPTARPVPQGGAKAVREPRVRLLPRSLSARRVGGEREYSFVRESAERRTPKRAAARSTRRQPALYAAGSPGYPKFRSRKRGRDFRLADRSLTVTRARDRGDLDCRCHQAPAPIQLGGGFWLLAFPTRARSCRCYRTLLRTSQTRA
jgi:hypothetical protein